MTADPTSLDRLHDVIVPPPVPWWPPAPGWYWVLGALLVLFALVVLRAFLHWQRNAYRREALAEWHRLESQLHDPGKRASVLAGMAELLKRTALSVWPREKVAALTGPMWYTFLDRTGAIAGFSSGYGAMLECATYDPRLAATLDQAKLKEASALVHRWIKCHRLDASDCPHRGDEDGGSRTNTKDEEESAC